MKLNKQLYCPFFSEVDNTGEYTLEKILTNTQDLLALVQRLRLSEETAWKHLAVFGENQEVIKVIGEIVGEEFKDFVSDVGHTNSLYCLIADDWLIWFMQTEKSFFEQRPIHREHINVTLFRFLQDLSPRILLCPGKFTLDNWWEKRNPFSQSAHKTNTFEIRKQELTAELQISPIFCQTAILDKELDPHYKNQLLMNENYAKNFIHVLGQKYDNNVIEDQKKNFKSFLQDLTNYYFESQQSYLQKLLKKSDIQLSDQLFADILQLHKKYVERINKISSELKSGLKWYIERLHYHLERLTDSFWCKIFTFKKFSADKLNGFIELTSPLILFQTIEFDSDKVTEALVNFFWELEKNEKTNARLSTEIKKYNQDYNKGDLSFFIKRYCDDMKTQTLEFHKLLTINFEVYWHDLERTTVIQLTPCAMNPVQSDDGKNQNISFVVGSGFKIEASKITQLFPPLSKYDVLDPLKAINDLKIISSFPLRNSNSSFLCLLELQGRYSLTHTSHMGINKITEIKVKDFVFVFDPTEQEYFLINNCEHTINMGTVSESNKLKDGQKIDLPYASGDLKSVVSATYCYKTKNMLLLTEKGQLFKFNILSSEVTEQVIKENKGDKITPKKLLSSIAQRPYTKLYSMKNENFFALRSGVEVIDIYNINLELKVSLPLTVGFRNLKIFSDNVNVYLVINNSSGFESYVLANLGSEVQVNKIEQSTTQSILGNPIIDIIKASQIKYGPPSVFIGSPDTTEFYFTRTQSFEKEFVMKFNEYVKSFPSFQSGMSIKMLEIEKIISEKVNLEPVKNVDSILCSRVPLQLCTIEANNLLPLIDGTRQKLSYFSSVMSIAESATYISFGHLEKILLSLKENKKLKVVSIVGRQSSGKSYLLNRIFGTRFSVAATRCTDGIWMSYARLVRDEYGGEQFEDFVVLDCEGLFSPRRNELEETKLLTVISGISDVTILNQDLSFNRVLNRLFNDLNSSVNRVKGSKYFKGILMMAVRDVGSDDALGAQKQTERNFQELIAKGDHQFLMNLFNGKIAQQNLNNFTNHELFAEEIAIMREEFLNINNDHWANGEEFVQNLKVILVQIYSDDGQSSDEHLKNIKSLQLENEILAAWGKLSKIGEKAQASHNYKFEVEGEEVTIPLKQSGIEFEPDLEDPSKDFNVVMNILREKFNENLKIDKVSKLEYNKFWTKFNEALKEIIGQRLFYLDKHFEMLLEKLDKSFTPEEKKNLEIRIREKLRAHTDNFALCLEPCADCTLRCVERKSHKDSNILKKKQLIEDIEKAKIALDNSPPEIKKRFREDSCYLDEIKNELKTLEEKITICKKNLSLAREKEKCAEEIENKSKSKKDLASSLQSDRLKLDSLEVVNNSDAVEKIIQEGSSELRAILDQTEKIGASFPRIKELIEKISTIINPIASSSTEDLQKQQRDCFELANNLRNAISELEKIKVIHEDLEESENRKKHLPILKNAHEICSQILSNSQSKVLQELTNQEKQVHKFLEKVDYKDIDSKLACKKLQCETKEKNYLELISLAEQKSAQAGSLDAQLKVKEIELEEIESSRKAISELKNELSIQEKKVGNLSQLADKEAELSKETGKIKESIIEIQTFLELKSFFERMRNVSDSNLDRDLIHLEQAIKSFKKLQSSDNLQAETAKLLEELKQVIKNKLFWLEELEALEVEINSLQNEQKESDTSVLEEAVKTLHTLREQSETDCKKKKAVVEKRKAAYEKAKETGMDEYEEELEPDRLEAMESELQTKQQQLDNALKTLEGQINEIEKLKARIVSLQTCPKKDFLAEIQKQITKKEILSQKLEENEKTLLKSLNETEDSFKELEQNKFSKKDPQTQLDSLEKELLQLTSEHVAIEASKQNQLHLLKKIQDQEQGIKEKNTLFEAIKDEYKKLQVELATKKDEFRSLSKKAEDEQNQITILKADLIIMEPRVSNFRLLHTCLNSLEEFKNLTVSNQESRDKLSILAQKLFQEHRECLKLSATIDNLIVTEKKLSEEIETFKKSFDSLYQQVSKSAVESEEELSLLQTSMNVYLNDKTEIEALMKNNFEYSTKTNELKEFEQSLRCLCTTDHKCEEICCLCPDMKPCKHPAGHGALNEPKEKIMHICSKEQHDCGVACEVIGCSNLCMYAQGHENPVYHRCSATHQCKEKCEFCLNTCVASQASEHSKHLCSEKLCPFKCILCGAACVGTHDHDGEGIKVEDPKDPKKLVNLHLCDKEHPCPQICEQKGVCEVHFITEKRTWEHSESIQEYEYIKPEAKIKPCMIAIPKGHYKHEGGHNCSKEHTCEQKCPECGSYCKLEIDHPGRHKALTHRNKEFCYCVTRDASKKVKVGEKGKQARVYNPGDQFTLETCHQQCTRKGRAHFHLIECKGGAKCGAKKFKGLGVKHCTDEEKYHPFPERNFDKYLCEQFWEHNNWVTPHEDKTVRLCNYYCPSKEHEKEDKKHFCEELAWHTDSQSAKDHKFECHDFSKETSFVGLDLCICMDTTGSMGSYITQSKEAIKAIINSLCMEGSVSKSSLRFSIVGYKDHCDPTVVQSINFTGHTEAISFLDGLEADGGGADTPEAVFDGLDAACKMSWKTENLKMIFHILDAPPHGEIYWTGDDSYPEGCPCGKTESILSKIKDKGIGYYLIPLDSSLNQMMSRFEKLITVNKKSLTDPVELPKIVCSTVCSLIEDPELTAVIYK